MKKKKKPRGNKHNHGKLSVQNQKRYCLLSEDGSVLHHLKSENHQKNHCLLNNPKNKEREAIRKGKECGVNCAGIAYMTLFFSESAKS